MSRDCSSSLWRKTDRRKTRIRSRSETVREIQRKLQSGTMLGMKTCLCFAWHYAFVLVNFILPKDSAGSGFPQQSGHKERGVTMQKHKRSTKPTKVFFTWSHIKSNTFITYKHPSAAWADEIKEHSNMSICWVQWYVFILFCLRFIFAWRQTFAWQIMNMFPDILSLSQYVAYSGRETLFWFWNGSSTVALIIAWLRGSH